MKSIFPPALHLLVLVLALHSPCNAAPADLVDLDGLRGGGDDWVVVAAETAEGGETLRLYQDKWLMFFLHWRPLTPDNQTISPDYVRDLLLNFWGPEMPFEVVDEGGEAEVGGHPARTIDGTIYDGKIRTRFFVWNCPETKRQFISDCNINQGLGTAARLLSLQFEATSTISCHGQNVAGGGPDTEPVTLEEAGLSLRVPDAWRTHVYTSEDWFPDGMQPRNGTIWTLPTDAEKLVVIRRESSVARPGGERLVEWAATLDGADFSSSGNVEVRIAAVRVGAPRLADGRWEADVAFRLVKEAGDQSSEEAFVARAVAWRHEDQTYLVLAGLLAREEVWGRPTDLSPSEEVLERFLGNEVLANVPAFRAATRE